MRRHRREQQRVEPVKRAMRPPRQGGLGLPLRLQPTRHSSPHTPPHRTPPLPPPPPPPSPMSGVFAVTYKGTPARARYGPAGPAILKPPAAASPPHSRRPPKTRPAATRHNAGPPAAPEAADRRSGHQARQRHNPAPHQLPGHLPRPA